MLHKTIVAGLVGAASLIMTLPATAALEGATTSSGATPVLDESATAEAVVAGERQFFVRRTGCTADQRLSVEEGAETSGCADSNSNTPLNEVNRTPTLYNAENGLPLTLDASRSAKGVVTLTSFQQPAYAGGGQVIVDVALSGKSGGSTIDLGSTSFNYVAIPTQAPVSTPWTITLPASADGKDLTALTLSLTVRGIHVTHGYVRPNATHLTLPTH